MQQSSGTVGRSCQILAAFVWGLLVLLTGCDECSSGATRCRGDVYGWCSHDDGEGPLSTAGWHETKCAVACRELDGGAFCVSSPDPIPECASASHAVCFAGKPATCLAGYPVEASACVAGTHCVVSAACGAICALEDNPDPACGARPFCDDAGNLTTCACGVVENRIDCGGADLCHQINDESYCTQSATPDPRCGDPSQAASGFCADGTAFSCWFGFLAGAFNCGATRCIERPGQPAACELPVSTQ